MINKPKNKGKSINVKSGIRKPVPRGVKDSLLAHILNMKTKKKMKQIVPMVLAITGSKGNAQLIFNSPAFKPERNLYNAIKKAEKLYEDFGQISISRIHLLYNSENSNYGTKKYRTKKYYNFLKRQIGLLGRNNWNNIKNHFRPRLNALKNDFGYELT